MNEWGEVGLLFDYEELIHGQKINDLSGNLSEMTRWVVLVWVFWMPILNASRWLSYIAYSLCQCNSKMCSVTLLYRAYRDNENVNQGIPKFWYL